MKNAMKKTAVLALAGTMAAGMLAGCGAKLDGSKTVATVNGEEIPMGLVSLAAREQQAQVEAMYKQFMGSTSNIWSTSVDEDSKKTYGDEQVEQTMQQVELWYLMRAKAADYGCEVTDEDETAIKAAAKEFMESNDEETIKELQVTEDQVALFLELETINARMYYALRNEAEVEITDEQATQSSFSYVDLNIAEDNTSEEDIAKRKEDAQKILDAMLEDPSADMDEVAQSFDESYSGLTGHYTKSEDEEQTSSYPDEVIAAVRELKEGEVCDHLVEIEGAIYIVRKDKDVDEDATKTQKTSLENQARSQYYTDTTQSWLDEADIKVEDKVLKTLQITDNHHFSFFTPTATPEPTEEAAEVTEEPAEAEVTEEPAEEEAAEEEAEATPAEEAADEEAEDAEVTPTEEAEEN